MKKERILLQILSGLGLVVTAYLVYQHYKPVGSSVCNINDYINCDIVNKSQYSEIFGIPVALLGFGAYAVFFITSFFRFQKFLGPLLLFVGIAAGFSLYLTYIEIAILRAICLFCVTQQILIISILIIYLRLLWLKKRNLL